MGLSLLHIHTRKIAVLKEKKEKDIKKIFHPFLIYIDLNDTCMSLENRQKNTSQKKEGYIYISFFDTFSSIFIDL